MEKFRLDGLIIIQTKYTELKYIWFTEIMGRRKLNRTSLHARVNPKTPEKLKAMAEDLGFTYTSNTGKIEGSTGQLLDAISESSFLIPVLKQIFIKPG